MSEFDVTQQQNDDSNATRNLHLKQSQIDEFYVNHFCFSTMAQNYAVLKLAVNTDNAELLELYTEHVAKHNVSVEQSFFPNSGFDLFVPSESVFDKDFITRFVDLKIKCEMLYCDKNLQVTLENDEGEPETVSGASYSCGYYVYPRSSISKTPLMLANHVGIIDSGYRGNLMAALRKLPCDKPSYVIEKHTRLFQICHPSLCPVFVVIVPESELNSSERGTGGFGSTGTGGVIK
jgi:dUTP pyrophosphatase